MGLRKHAIDWRAEPDVVGPNVAAPSPALELQAMLQQRQAALAAPAIDRDTLRRLVMMSAAAGCALWMTLLTSADIAVSLIA